MQHFKDGIFSHLVGVRKPNIEIYKLVLTKTGSLPEECVYIDDKAELLEPARELGMQSIHFVNAGDLKSRLEGMKVYA